MVDPHRNLTPEQIQFLKQCEEEFQHRFTDRDPQFVKVLQREPYPPPFIHPWQQQRSRNFNNRNNFRGRGYGQHGGQRFDRRPYDRESNNRQQPRQS